MAISEKNLPDLRKYLAGLPYAQKYNQTAPLISRFDNFDFSEHIKVLKILYEDLLYDFPFNHKWWIKYAEKYISVSQPEKALEIYQQAVQANPSSVELWEAYTSLLVKTYGNNDSELVINNFEKAIEAINLDVDSKKIYDGYFNYLESKNYQNHELTTDTLFWRLKTYPLSQADEFIARFEKFVDALDQPIYFQLLENHSDLNLPNEKICINNEFYLLSVKRELYKNAYASSLKSSIGKIPYGDDGQKLLQLMENKTEFEGVELNQKSIDAIKDLLYHYRKTDTHARTVFLYRKAFPALANDGAFWTEYFHVLDSHQSTRGEVKPCLNIYNSHFKIIKNKESLLFYQADLKESKADFTGAKEVLVELEKSGNFEAYIRHIYLEIRSNNLQNVFDVFASLCNVVQDPDQMIFAIQEIGDILNKLGEADRAISLIKQFSEKADYSKYFLSSWVNFLKICQKPWEDIEETFKFSLKKASKPEDRQEIWNLYLYTARGYCNNVEVIRELERRCALEHETNDAENGVNKKRKFENVENDDKDLKKQVKTD